MKSSKFSHSTVCSEQKELNILFFSTISTIKDYSLSLVLQPRLLMLGSVMALSKVSQS